MANLNNFLNDALKSSNIGLLSTYDKSLFNIGELSILNTGFGRI